MRRQATYRPKRSAAECILIALSTITTVAMVTLTIAVLMGY